MDISKVKIEELPNIPMLIEPKDPTVRGGCAFCHKEGARFISLTFNCWICDEKCDEAYWNEYVQACIEANERSQNDDASEETCPFS